MPCLICENIPSLRIVAARSEFDDSVPSQEQMDAWVAQKQSEDLLPWAAALVARAWRRHCLRRRLMRFARLRRRMKRLFLLPYLSAWHEHALTQGRGDFIRKCNAFYGWWEYCLELAKLHGKVIEWMERTVAQMGGLDLTWRLCAPPEGSDSCASPIMELWLLFSETLHPDHRPDT